MHSQSINLRPRGTICPWLVSCNQTNLGKHSEELTTLGCSIECHCSFPGFQIDDERAGIIVGDDKLAWI